MIGKTSIWNDSWSTLPFSRLMSSHTSSARSSSRSRKRRTMRTRSDMSVAAHPRCAARARATTSRACSTECDLTSPIFSPLAGLRTWIMDGAMGNPPPRAPSGRLTAPPPLDRAPSLSRTAPAARPAIVVPFPLRPRPFGAANRCRARSLTAPDSPPVSLPPPQGTADGPRAAPSRPPAP